jgi:hypothetical protein
LQDEGGSEGAIHPGADAEGASEEENEGEEGEDDEEAFHLITLSKDR